jgi:4-methylaminobutanoate oxidase (formaldehyde-forming)
MDELLRQASTCRGSNIPVEVVEPPMAVKLFPLLSPAGLIGALWFPDDGRGNAADTTMSLARGARMRGVTIAEGVAVQEVLFNEDSVTGVRTDTGVIETEVVVNCTGMWARQFAATSGVRLPLQALHHYYLITDTIPDLPADMPTIKSGDDCSYVKDETGKLMVGFFEPGSSPWQPDGVPEDAEFVTLPENWDHIGPFYEKMIDRIPILSTIGIRLFFCGPESFTPDGAYHLGPVPGVRNYYTACGFNSVGFLSGPGAGSVLADWIVDGRAPIDIPEADPRRIMPHNVNPRYVIDRTVETLDRAYAIHWPYEQRETARGIRRSPLHAQVGRAGAVFGEVAGWERPDWYAVGAGVDKRNAPPSFKKQPWETAVKEEHIAVRERVGLFDLSSFGKILVSGSDALHLLERVSTNMIDVRPGRVVYTQWLNEAGGIEADVTVTRLSATSFLVLTAAASVVRDMSWLQLHTASQEHVTIVDWSAALAMMTVMGPMSRELLSRLTSVDLGNSSFEFGQSRDIDFGYTFVRATRISYVGELGWELLIPSDQAAYVYESLLDAGQAFGLRHVGYRALDSLRLEKGFRSYPHDMGPLDTPLEAGLGFTISWSKVNGFIGRNALARLRDDGPPCRRLLSLVLEDISANPLHEEPIYLNDVLVGRLTSAGFGYSVGRPVALGWVDSSPVLGFSHPERSWFEGRSYEVEVASERFPARAMLASPYDPKSDRMRI